MKRISINRKKIVLPQKNNQPCLLSCLRINWEDKKYFSRNNKKIVVDVIQWNFPLLAFPNLLKQKHVFTKNELK